MDRFEVLMLDRYEGCPSAYCRVLRTVVDEMGGRREAYVYVQPNRGLEFRAPGLEYWEAILGAYERLNFDRRPLLRAEGVRP
jgi:hypothetical protein